MVNHRFKNFQGSWRLPSSQLPRHEFVLHPFAAKCSHRMWRILTATPRPASSDMGRLLLGHLLMPWLQLTKQ
jgi:hypothetical protein